MAWWNVFTRRGTPTPKPPPTPAEQQPNALTAAAAPVKEARTELIRNTDTWQEEAWGFYDDLGEFRYGVEWVSAMLSRIRLYAAKLEPGADEPVRAEAGTAVDFMTTFGGGTTGRSQLMSGFATQLAVPGEGYLVGETINGVEQWTVRSTDEVRVARGRFEVIDDTTSTNGVKWRSLGSDSLVTRVWRPHKRFHYRADSPARAARGKMRELELVNRYIISQFLSRLASAGVVMFPDEITFPVREEFADAPDPFMAEWIEIAAEAIRTPGTAAAVVPIPIKVPAEYVDKIKHLDFTLRLDEKILDKRESAIKGLATMLNMPAEVLLGMGDVNHWGAWQLEEGALKTHIAPEAELICQFLTQGYLQPRLRASGVEDWANWVVWYDMSELTLRPDRSDDAFAAYDRMEIGGPALRRETGFTEEDKPSDEELKEQALKVIIKTLPSAAPSALSLLTGQQVDITSVVPDSSTPQRAGPSDAEPPPQGERNPPDPDEAQQAATAAHIRQTAAAARQERLVQQAQALHAVRFAAGRPPELLHPGVCSQYAYSCPFTHAALKLHSLPRPGTSGVYEARLDAFGRFTIGRHAPLMDVSGFFSTTRSANGFAHSRG